VTEEAEKNETKELAQNIEEAKETHAAEVSGKEVEDDALKEDADISLDKESTGEDHQQIVTEQIPDEIIYNAKQAKCQHLNISIYEDRSDANCTEIKGDNEYHNVTGKITKEVYCDDCGKKLKSTTTQFNGEEEKHHYDGKVCEDCDHKNTCKHGDTDKYEDWSDSDVTCTEIKGDNRFHKATGTIVIVTKCYLCGAKVKEDTIQIKGKKSEHDYEDGECTECGYINKCRHKHTDYDYIIDSDIDDVSFKKVNDTYHRVTGTVNLDTWCEDCGETIKSREVTIDEKFYHHYNSRHICTDCGQKNNCKHPSEESEYDYDDEVCKIADTGDGSRHKVTGNITEITYCKVCKEQSKKERLGKTTVTEPHEYDRDDVCIYCGYQKPDIRAFGDGRYDTAIEVAEEYKGSAGKFENVIVAYGQNFPDALSGGYLAKTKNAPILLVEPSVEDRIAEYISNNILIGGKVYILGGTGAVSAAFESKVKAKGISTTRLGGKDRYETNQKILTEAGVKSEDILVCMGTGFADSLSAAAVGKPILLVGNSLTNDQKKYIKGLSSKKIYLIGGEGAVKPAVETGLKDLGFSKVERIAGKTRYETSTEVAKKFFSKAKTVVLAYAQNFPDGLSGGPLAMMKNAPIILTDPENIEAARAYVKSAGAGRNVTLGGPALISDTAVKEIMSR